MVSVAPVVELGLGAPSAFDTYADSLDVLLANPSWFEQLQPAASGHVQTASPSLAETPWEATPSAPHFCREALAKDVASVGRLGSVSGTLPSTEIGRFGGGPAAQAPSDSLQRKASVSREAQRRFRQRKKAC